MGFGLGVGEAMSWGTPTFVWRATALPEVAGDLAFYWDADDSAQMTAVFVEGMSRVRHTPDYAASLRSYVGRFTWEHAASAYLDVYRSIIQH